jgi:hypothetical protein
MTQLPRLSLRGHRGARDGGRGAASSPDPRPKTESNTRG